MNRKAPKLVNNDYIPSLYVLFNMPRLRSVDTWEPGGRGRETNFRSLVDHLVCRYRVPIFFYSIFSDRTAVPAGHGERNSRLFIHIATGGSVKAAVADGLIPTPLTARMCHLFLQAPQHCTVVQAVRHAQVLAYGGSSRLIKAVSASILRDFLADEPFWMTVIQWFCQNPMLDTTQVSPLIDYILHRKRENPAFSMKGRSALALLRDMEIWHQDLAKVTRTHGTVYKPSGFTEFETIEGTEQEPVVWSVKEIKSSKELQDEGRDLRHCVYSYSRQIEAGRTSIWSMTKSMAFNPPKRHLTIQVINSSHAVVQARGFGNRLPDTKERSVLQQWASRNGIYVSDY